MENDWGTGAGPRHTAGPYDLAGRILFQHLSAEPFRYYRRLSKLGGKGGRVDVEHDNIGVHRVVAPKRFPRDLRTGR